MSPSNPNNRTPSVASTWHNELIQLTRAQLFELASPVLLSPVKDTPKRNLQPKDRPVHDPQLRGKSHREDGEVLIEPLELRSDDFATSVQLSLATAPDSSLLVKQHDFDSFEGNVFDSDVQLSLRTATSSKAVPDYSDNISTACGVPHTPTLLASCPQPGPNLPSLRSRDGLYVASDFDSSMQLSTQQAIRGSEASTSSGADDFQSASSPALLHRSTETNGRYSFRVRDKPLGGTIPKGLIPFSSSPPPIDHSSDSLPTTKGEQNRRTRVYQDPHQTYLVDSNTLCHQFNTNKEG